MYGRPHFPRSALKEREARALYAGFPPAREWRGGGMEMAELCAAALIRASLSFLAHSACLFFVLPNCHPGKKILPPPSASSISSCLRFLAPLLRSRLAIGTATPQ